MLELDVLDYQRKQAGQQNDGAGANAFGNKKAVIAAKGMVHLWKVSHSSFLPKKRKKRKAFATPCCSSSISGATPKMSAFA